MTDIKTISEGRGSLDDLARILAGLDRMFFLPPSGRLLQYLEDAARQAVPPVEPFRPPLHGILYEGTFIPAVFSTMEAADALARLNGFVAEDEPCAVHAKSWKLGLHEFLLWGYGGAVVDGGTDHKISLNRDNLALLVTKLTLAELAGAGQLYAAMEGERLHVHPAAPGQGVIFIYDTELGARHGGDFLAGNVAGAEGVRVRPMKTAALLTMLETVRPAQMLINFGLPDARPCGGADLEEFKRRAAVAGC